MGLGFESGVVANALACCFDVVEVGAEEAVLRRYTQDIQHNYLKAELGMIADKIAMSNFLDDIVVMFVEDEVVGCVCIQGLGIGIALLR